MIPQRSTKMQYRMTEHINLFGLNNIHICLMFCDQWNSNIPMHVTIFAHA